MYDFLILWEVLLSLHTCHPHYSYSAESSVDHPKKHRLELLFFFSIKCQEMSTATNRVPIGTTLTKAVRAPFGQTGKVLSWDDGSLLCGDGSGDVVGVESQRGESGLYRR